MATKEEYEKALNEMNDAFYGITFLRSETRRFDDNLSLLRELVNEHFEEKQETNFEHYFEYLSKRKMSDFALIDGRVTNCLGTSCSECDFDSDCIEGKFKWLRQTYKKPTYKLTQFEYDLLRTNNMDHDRKLSSFATYENLREIGYFKDIDFDLTIHEILENCEVIE